jgi:hypothetical protein
MNIGELKPFYCECTYKLKIKKLKLATVNINYSLVYSFGTTLVDLNLGKEEDDQYAPPLEPSSEMHGSGKLNY